MAIKRISLNLVELFGKDRAQEDENLQYYFIKTQQYQEIKRGDKELVLGRKGSGKSALFSILAKEASDSENTIPVKIEYSCAVKPPVRQTGNRLSGPEETAVMCLLT